MKLTVEFLGLSRRLAQTKECLITIEDQASLRDVLRALAAQFPALVGQVIIPDTFDLVPSYMISLDGRQAVRDLDSKPQDNQRLVLMFMEAGG